MNRVLLALFIGVLLVGHGMAQEFRATIGGTIKDSTGGAVIGAHVTITDVDKGTESKTVSNELGLYTVPFLTPGHYSVTVEAAGFKQFVRKDITLAIGDHRTIDVSLQVGAVSDSVTVTGEAGLVTTDVADQGGIILKQLVADVPNPGRQVFAFVWAMPGVIRPSTNINTQVDIGSSDTPVINGAAGGANGNAMNTMVTLNGVMDITGGNNSKPSTPGLAAVEEVKVLSNTYDAEYGRSAGGIVEVVTKSGTNSIHGEAFTRFYDWKWKANSWENNRVGLPKSKGSYQNPGFEVAGPVYIPKLLDLRNKLFFMVSYENTLKDGTGTASSTVPLPQMLTGDFNGVLTAAGAQVQIFDPLTTRLGPDGKTYTRDMFPDNRIPTNRINPVAAKIFSYYPKPTNNGTPNAHGQNYQVLIPGYGRLPQWIGRGDWKPTVKDSISAQYLNQDSYSWASGMLWGVDNPGDPSSKLPSDQRGRNLSMDWSRILSPTMTFNLRGGFARKENLNGTAQSDGFNPATLGFSQAYLSMMPVYAFPKISFSGGMSYGGFGAMRNTSADDTYQITTMVSKVWGRHIMKAGAQAASYRDTSFNPGSGAGSFSFAQAWTQQDPNKAVAGQGSEMASFLLGYPSGGSVDLNANPAWRSSDWSIYFQDDFKLTSRLTLNLGIRWEYQTAPVERYNRANAGFAFGQANPLQAAVKAGDTSNCPACLQGLTGYDIFAGVNGASRASYTPSKRDFAPRAGFAWTITPKTVMRGGFAMMSIGIGSLGNNGRGYMDGFSISTPLIASLDGGLTPYVTLSNPFPTGLIAPTGSSLGASSLLGLGLTANYANFKTPTSYQYSLGFQREIPGQVVLEGSFVGNYANHLPVGYSLNYTPTPFLYHPASYYQTMVTNPFAGLLPNNAAMNKATVTLGSLLTAYPQYSGVTINNIPVGTNNYMSGQFVATRRFNKGLTAMVNYTVSKNLMRQTVLNAQDYNPADPESSGLEKRLSPYDLPQKLAIIWTYEMPFGRGRMFGGHMPRLFDYVAGGWKVSMNTLLQSGFPVPFPNAAPLRAGSAKLSPDQQTYLHWFDTSLFPTTAQAPYTLRNFPTMFPDVRYQAGRNVDMALSKEFHIFERIRAQYRCDFINAFNTPQIGNIKSVDVTSPLFGQMNLGQLNDQRKLYMDIKILW